MKTILLADDETNLAEILRYELEELGFRVTVARNGVDAVLKALDESFDMAVLDIMMPHLNGINTLKILKKINPAIPVITFTAVAGNGEISASMKAGALRCISKPFSTQYLVTEIRKTLHA